MHDRHVAICICTYRRPAGLAALLRSLQAQVFDGPPPRITVIVVENCPEAPATAVLGPLSARVRWNVVEVTEPRRGIVAARNRALAMVPADADAVAFLDDDEEAVPGWLAAMLATRARTRATALQGPVLPRYAVPPPRWVETSGLFVLGPYPDGAPLRFASTNNVLVDAGFLRATGLRFDMRFNQTGGEDEEFFQRLLDAGGTIRASAGGVVHDHVPPQRMTLRWALRRRFRMGNTLSRIALLRGRGRALRLAKGLGALGRGTAQAAAGVFVSQARMYGGVLEIARGAGMLAGFANLSLAEYGAAAVRADRPERDSR